MTMFKCKLVALLKTQEAPERPQTAIFASQAAYTFPSGASQPNFVGVLGVMAEHITFVHLTPGRGAKPPLFWVF